MSHVDRPKRESSLPSHHTKPPSHEFSQSTDTLPNSLFTDQCTLSDTPTQDISLLEPRQSNSSSRESTLVDPTPPPQPHQQLKRSKSAYYTSPSILRTSSHEGNSMPASPSISFAPLPTMEARKRKSSAQMGVAARSRMLQQRRAARMQALDAVDDDAPPANIWKDTSGGAEEDEDGDPFLAFGQFMKGAGKGLWRKVSVKDVNKLKEKKKDKRQGNVQGETVPPMPVNYIVELSRDMVDAEDNEGRVWEEEIDTIRTIREYTEIPGAEPAQQEPELEQPAPQQQEPEQPTPQQQEHERPQIRDRSSSSFRALPPTPRVTSVH